MTTVSKGRAQTRLTIVWCVGVTVAAACLLFGLRSYSQLGDSMQKWFVLNLGPTTGIVLSSLFSPARATGRVSRLSERIAIGAAVLYLFTVIALLVAQALHNPPVAEVDRVTELSILHSADTLLAFLQSMAALAFGYFFQSHADEAPAKVPSPQPAD